MDTVWKCDICQQNCTKLVAPFAGSLEKYCLTCFATCMRLVASEKPELAENYNKLIKQAEKELESSPPYSITFIKKISEWGEKKK